MDNRQSVLELSRQEMLISSKGMDRLTFAIIGGGGIGSNVAYMLSRMGAAEGSISLYDFDRVSLENVAPARFSVGDVDEMKVYAIREGIKSELGIDTIIPYPIPFGPEEDGEYDIIIACPDTMDVRRDVWESPLLEWEWLIDARMGGDQAEIYIVGPGREGNGLDTYEQAVSIEDTPLLCGEKATAPVSAGVIPGFVGSAVANIANGHAPPIHMFFSMNSAFGAVLTVQRDEASA